MDKARYTDPEKPIAVKQMGRFIRDLAFLAEQFGLVISCWHPKKRFWLSLEDLVHQSSARVGQSFLKYGLFRVYTKEDFLTRWRDYFAMRMGFSAIPTCDCEQPIENHSPTDSAESFAAYLRKAGISVTELARQLGVSKSLVSYHLSGKRGWTLEWQNRIRNWLGSVEEKKEGC